MLVIFSLLTFSFLVLNGENISYAQDSPINSSSLSQGNNQTSYDLDVQSINPYPQTEITCDVEQKPPLSIIVSPSNNKDEILNVMVYSSFDYYGCDRQHYLISILDENGRSVYNSNGYSYDFK